MTNMNEKSSMTIWASNPISISHTSLLLLLA